LLRRGVPAIDVARSTGFFDSAHLTRAFRAELGITPGAYARATR
jgi:AraC-like DNA-binding protein